MKNIKFIGCLLFVISLPALNQLMAQDNITPLPEKENYNKLELGMIMMPTFASYDLKTFNGEIISGDQFRGYGYGATLAYNFSRHLGSEVEVISNSFSKTYRDDYLTRDVKIKYIDVPILFSLSTDKSVPLSFQVILGPQIGFNAGSSTNTSVNQENDSLKAVLSTKKLAFDLAYGAGLNFGFSRLEALHVSVGFRGSYGLTNLNNDETISSGAYYVLGNSILKTYSAYVSIKFALR